MEQEIPFDHHGISGGIAVKLKPGKSLDDFCMEHLPTYNPDRLEVIAIRLFAGKETIITVYALDKSRQDLGNYDKSKLPVKKFKIENLPAGKLFEYFEEYNFTLSTGNYSIEDMDVTNV